ncbi:2583_t:CDS:2 [Ambispora gerdemannii]|uniref:2583_t:CDS:1 n=1 Tax=Ambispora gerdemannii TaxID=144530 RepID=A0A9N9BB58_9GLOM|nr:2583_t:CDS:2 [Ambispora gerdemannii]
MPEITATVLLSFLMTGFTYVLFTYVFVHFLIVNGDNQKRKNVQHNNKHHKSKNNQKSISNVSNQKSNNHHHQNSNKKLIMNNKKLFYTPVSSVTNNTITRSNNNNVSVVFSTLPKGTKPLPGPTPIPVIGNLHQLSDPLHMTFNQMALKFGPIFKINLGNNKVLVVLNDYKVANELLDQNEIYQPCDSILGVKSISPSMRTIAQQALSPKIIESNYLPIICKESINLARHFYKNAGILINPVDELTRSISKTFSLITFGHSAEKFSLDFMEFLESANALEQKEIQIESLQFLRKISSTQQTLENKVHLSKSKYAEISKQLVDNLKKQATATNVTSDKCFTAEILKSMKPKNEKEFINLSSNLLFDGIENTLAELKWVFVLLSYAPQVQHKIMQELSRVVEKGKFPNVKDYANLHYLRATVKEIMRFRPVGFFSQPHIVTKNDVYQGYHIPQNANVIFNTNTLHFNQALFERAKRFSPERYLDEQGRLKQNPKSAEIWMFGKGPNASISEYLTEITLSAIVAHTLSLFIITPEIDETTGDEKEINMEGVSNGFKLNTPPNYSVIFELRKDVDHEKVFKENY